MQVLLVGSRPAAEWFSRQHGLDSGQVYSVLPSDPDALARIALGRSWMEVVTSGEDLRWTPAFVAVLRHMQARWSLHRSGAGWKRSDLPSWLVCTVVRRQGVEAWEFLTDRIGAPDRVIRAAYSRDVARDYLDYGTCLERPFLTERGYGQVAPVSDLMLGAQVRSIRAKRCA